MFFLQVLLGTLVFDIDSDFSTTDFYVPFKRIASCSLLLAYVDRSESTFHKINFVFHNRNFDSTCRSNISYCAGNGKLAESRVPNCFFERKCNYSYSIQPIRHHSPTGAIHNSFVVACDRSLLLGVKI